MTKHTSAIDRRAAVKSGKACVSHEAWLLEHLKDTIEAGAYVEAAVEARDQPALKLALRNVAMAQSGEDTGDLESLKE